MSIFASQVTATQDFVCAPGQSFTVRKLSAAQTKEVSNLEDGDFMGIARLSLKYGLVSWTYDRPIDDEAVLSDLTQDALNEIVVAIAKLTSPGFYETKEQAEVAQKND